MQPIAGLARLERTMMATLRPHEMFSSLISLSERTA